MKNRIASCLLGIMSLGVAAVVQAAPADGAAEKAVAAIEEQWTQSEKTNNPDLLAPFLADKLIYIDIDGSIANRAKFLADAKTTKYASVDIQDFHIAVFGQTAIATMVFKAKGTDPKGKPLDYNARWVDTYVRMPDGKWQCVLSQGSDLKKS
jgi:ketosteroid isomerase-like protein